MSLTLDHALSGQENAPVAAKQNALVVMPYDAACCLPFILRF